MLQLLRASGLRIRDAATLERRRIKDGKLFLYTQKTGTPVYVPLPPAVLDALNQLLEQLVRKLHVGVFRSPSTSSITKGPVGRTFRSAVVDAVGPDL
jgi:integrase